MFWLYLILYIVSIFITWKIQRQLKEQNSYTFLFVFSLIPIGNIIITIIVWFEEWGKYNSISEKLENIISKIIYKKNNNQQKYFNNDCYYCKHISKKNNECTILDLKVSHKNSPCNNKLFEKKD